MGVGRAILSRDRSFLSAFNPSIWFITLGNQSAFKLFQIPLGRSAFSVGIVVMLFSSEFIHVLII